jgi:hypothetical protein
MKRGGTLNNILGKHRCGVYRDKFTLVLNSYSNFIR